MKVVPEAGLEPARSYEQRILSPLRLPIPSFGHKRNILATTYQTAVPETRGALWHFLVPHILRLYSIPYLSVAVIEVYNPTYLLLVLATTKFSS